MTNKNKTIKLISTLLIVSILLPTVLFSIPKQVSAQAGSTAAFSVPVADIPQEQAGWLSQFLHVTNTSSTITNTATSLQQWAQKILEQILKTIAKQVLAKMTQATINWINSDFHGAPLFLENPESFFKDIAKSEVRRLVDMIGYDSLKYPFGKQVALNVINSYKRQLADNAQYTLSKVINDPDLLVRYRNDFNYGGWNGFLINTQYPQNNYLGFQMIVQQNLASRLEGTFQAPAQKVQSLLQQGMGFLSPQTCPSNPAYNNGYNEFKRPTFKTTVPYDPSSISSEEEAIAYDLEYQTSVAAEKEAWAVENTCPGGLKNTTPGSVAANQIFSALNSPFLTTALDGALGNSLAAIFDALLNHFLSTGLSALSGTASSGSSGDNWSYNGQTLDGNNNGNTRTLNIPTNVSVRVGETTSTTISGGTGNYRIKTPPDMTKATARIETSSSSGPRLIITGIAPITPSNATRTTTVVIEDLSDPTIASVTVNITINALGVLAISPATIETDTNTSNSITATISGGTEPYSIQTNPNEEIAIARLSGTSLVVIGVNEGETFVTIRDSSNAVIRVTIKIAAVEDLNIPQSLLVLVGQTTTATISGGVAPYAIESVFGTSANIQVSTTNSAQLIITGISEGSTGIIVKDSSPQIKRASTSITTISDPQFMIVNPQNIVMGRGQTTNAAISGGSTPYKIKMESNMGKVVARINGNTLSVTSGDNKVNNAYVIIEDSSGQNVRVNIRVN